MSNTPIEIRVQLFAGAAEAVGERQAIVQVDSKTQNVLVAQLRTALVEQFPALAALSSRSRFALGKQFANEDDTVTASDEVVLIPPVSGG